MPAKTETDEADQRPLSESMNTATRAVHAKLNKLVISRLSLALPPKAEDASNYVSGLLHITPIYIAFESLWNNILQSAARDDEDDDVDEDDANRDPFATAATAAVLAQPCNICDPDTTQSEPMDLQTLPGILDYEGPTAASRLASVSALQPRMRTVLTALRVPGLARAVALQRDVVALTGWSRHTVAEHLDDAAESPVLAEFLHHVRHAVAARPHVLVAYAWVLYMALFSGGRVIRASLERVHPAFWVPAWASASLTSARRRSEAEDEGAGGPPLRFFSFDPTTAAEYEDGRENEDADTGADVNGDGEALKATFKRRLAETEGLLTADERDDVADEALAIFVFLVRVVEELDDICDTEPQEAGGGGMLALRSRDSVVVKKERRALALMARRVAAEQEQEAAREQGRERGKGKEKGNGKGRGSRGGWRGKIDKVIPGRRSDV